MMPTIHDDAHCPPAMLGPRLGLPPAACSWHRGAPASIGYQVLARHESHRGGGARQPPGPYAGKGRATDRDTNFCKTARDTPFMTPHACMHYLLRRLPPGLPKLPRTGRAGGTSVRSALPTGRFPRDGRECWPAFLGLSSPGLRRPPLHQPWMLAGSLPWSPGMAQFSGADAEEVVGVEVEHLLVASSAAVGGAPGVDLHLKPAVQGR